VTFGRAKRANEYCSNAACQIGTHLGESASPNGSVTALRYKADDTGEALAVDPLADHTERGGFELPVSIVILDQSGEAVRVSIEQDRVTYP
jgi:hypothetical protein